MAHFNIPTAERRKYLSEKLQLDKNPLLQIENRSSRLLEILVKYWNCFDFYGNRLPKCKSDVIHHISTGASAPIKSKCRPLNPIIAAKVRDKLEDLEKRGIVRKSSSPWASPILIVLKKDNDFRLVADYRKINQEIIGNAWPIPNMQTTLTSLANQKFFSTLDLKEAFYSVKLSTSSIPKSAIITPWGLYEYLRSNFGLKDSMNVYCRMIASVLGHLKQNEVINYVDDSIVLGKDFENHLDNLDKTLEAFSNNGLILKVEKCQIAKQETEFLGQRITPEGIRPIDRYIDAIKQIENPKNLKQLRSLIGKFTYYAKFIEHFAEIISPLSNLVKGHSEDRKDVPITLGEDAITAIDILKTKLMEAPILTYPDFTSDALFIATTDASFTGLSYIISQVQGGMEKIICYGSMKLSEAEKNTTSINLNFWE